MIPTKDRAALLEQTLRSIAEQSMPPVEVIVADDGSTDHTEEVAREFGAHRIFNARGDWGPCAARNTAMRLARTRYVAFIDSDDLYRPRALELLHKTLESRADAPFSFGRGLAAHREPGGWESDGLIGPRSWELDDFLCSLYARNSIPSGGVLARRETTLALGGFDDRSVFSQDHALWIQLARQGEPAYVPEVVCIHRRHPGNRMSPMVAADYSRLITDIAKEDTRLAHCVPRRLGMQMCEVAIEAAQRRSLAGLATATDYLIQGHRRWEIMRAARSYWRLRREGGREGHALLETEPELRDWLADYR